MKIIFDKSRQKVPIKSWCNDPESGAVDQAINVSNHPAIFHHFSLMPDTHQGYGMPIGGVAALKNAVSPNMVGVDIACGMMANRFDFRAEDLSERDKISIMREIRRLVPMGKNHQKDISLFKKEAGNLFDKYSSKLSKIRRGSELVAPDKIAAQLGTLGGGNHFIELQSDEKDDLWIMLHSGSRNIGKRVCDMYNRMALELDQKYHFVIPNKELSFLPVDSEEGQSYLTLMNFCMDFSYKNRECMFKQVIRAVKEVIGYDIIPALSINIHHNYASEELHYGEKVWVHRKGATLAAADTVGIIPGSMGARSFIIAGKGNPESFASCSHGAGRRMSRHAAKNAFTLNEFKESMRNIVFNCTGNLLDESPMAYKNIDIVMDEQKDLVEIVHVLKPLAVEKG